MEPFEAIYRKMFDPELLSLAEQPDALLPEARQALRSELRRRGLEEEAARRERESRDVLSAAKLSEPDQSKLLPVFSARNEIEGRLVQDMLEAGGIQSILRRQVSSILFPGTCEILVLESNAEGAGRIIAEYQQRENGPTDETEATDEGSPGES